jgi:hypothetical protein
MMQILPDAIRFSSKLKFVSTETFDKLPLAELKAKGQYLGAPYAVHNHLSGTTAGYTDNIFICNSVGLCNPKHMSLFHHYPAVRPGKHDPEIASNTALNEAKSLREENPDVRALQLGGEKSHEMSAVYGAMQYDKFQKAHIPTSLFWGHNNETMSTTRLCYDTQQDTWFINTQHHTPEAVDGEIVLYQEDVLSPETLKNVFSVIQVDPGDQLYLGDREVSGTEVNQCSEPSVRKWIDNAMDWWKCNRSRWTDPMQSAQARSDFETDWEKRTMVWWGRKKEELLVKCREQQKQVPKAGE